MSLEIYYIASAYPTEHEGSLSLINNILNTLPDNRAKRNSQHNQQNIQDQRLPLVLLDELVHNVSHDDRTKKRDDRIQVQLVMIVNTWDEKGLGQRQGRAEKDNEAGGSRDLHCVDTKTQ